MSDDGTDPNEGFREYRRTGDRSRRNALVEEHLGLAYYLANRYADRGVELHDLRQVGVIGLVKAVERFDPDHGASFATFARTYITGEIRHHFRDAGWELHVPRPVKARAQTVRQAVITLRADLDREPTVADLVAETGLTQDEVLEALDVSRVTRTRRFSAATSDDEPAIDPEEPEDATIEVEQRVVLEQLLATLDERDRAIVVARFYEEKTQQQIADEIGVSQVHVSRLLRKILADLRESLPEDPEAAPIDAGP